MFWRANDAKHLAERDTHHPETVESATIEWVDLFNNRRLRADREHPSMEFKHVYHT